MLNKNFNLTSFKSQASKMSDFLNGKGHNIPKTTLYHGLSVMFGEKNWNTLQSKFNNLESTQKTETDLKDNNPLDVFKSQSFYFLNKYYQFSDMYKTFNFFFDDEYFLHKKEHFNFNLSKIYNFPINDDIIDNLDNPLFLAKNINFFDKQQTYVVYNLNEYVMNQTCKGELIGDELLMKKTISLNFTKNKEDNEAKILSMILFILSFYPESEYGNNFFSHRPIVRTRSSGSKIKLTIFSFVNADYRSNFDGQIMRPNFMKSPRDFKLSSDALLFDYRSANTMFNFQSFFASLNDKEECDKLFMQS